MVSAMTHYLLEIIPHAIWAAIGAAAVQGYRAFQHWRNTKGHRAIFAGLEEPEEEEEEGRSMGIPSPGSTLFVFPPRVADDSGLEQPRMIPLMAIEDFLGINNIVSAYMKAGRRPPHRVRDSTHLSDEYRRICNLILMCSSRSNPVTAEALQLLRSNPNLGDRIPVFERIPDTSEWTINWKGAIYRSPSYSQSGTSYQDVAMIVKVRSPWDAQRKILIVAGIRGIGTWGAAEYLKKWWIDLYEKKRKSRRHHTSKSGDFAALLKVEYGDQDIKRVELIHLEDLDVDSTA